MAEETLTQKSDIVKFFNTRDKDSKSFQRGKTGHMQRSKKENGFGILLSIRMLEDNEAMLSEF